MKLERLDGDVLCQMMQNATNLLKDNKSVVDALNVFPVPDGDTGTNMSLTMLSAVAETEKSGKTSVAEVAEALALGSLMGARGNSGVILSQLFRGLAKGLSGREAADKHVLVSALGEGVRTAYKAVMKPVEGTILTVMREASEGAANAALEKTDIVAVWRAACKSAESALARTTDMLPVLKQAKVVDAGGKGLVYILNGALAALTHRGADLESSHEALKVGPGFEITEEMADIRFPYDTQLLVSGSGLDIDRLRLDLDSLGDSLLVVGSPDVIRVHVHTGEPDRVLRACLNQGSVSRVTIDDMREQHREFKQASVEPAFGGGSEGVAGEAASPQDDEDEEEKPVGVVTVASGAGLIDVLKSLGADVIIDGGQTMNPSTEDVVKAVNGLKARRAIFLPNNGNIFLAAKQAKRFSDKKMYVVPSRSVPQGIAALLTLRPENNMETNLKRMAKAIRQIKTGEITYAVRKSQYNGFLISEGDILGMWDGDISVVGKDPFDVLKRLLEKMVGPSDEVITIFSGCGLREDEVLARTGSLEAQFGQCEIEVREGGQPLYYFIVSVE